MVGDRLRRAFAVCVAYGRITLIVPGTAWRWRRDPVTAWMALRVSWAHHLAALALARHLRQLAPLAHEAA